MDVKVITGADPAAGAEVLETVPADTFWRLLAVQFVLTASAAVFNRRVHLIADGGGTTTEFWRAWAGLNHIADEATRYSWAPGASSVALAGEHVSNPMPSLVLPPGFRIRTVTPNLQAGDNYSAPVLYVVEFDSLAQALTAL